MAASALTALLPLGGVQSVAAAPPRACFWASQVSGFDDDGPNRVVVRIGTRERWELTLVNGCPDADRALTVGIVARGGERICSGRPAQLIVPVASGAGAQRCQVSAIRRLSAPGPVARRGSPPP